MIFRRTRLPRLLHPGAWWLWAVGLATSASRTTNPLLLVLLIAVAGYVVAARRTTAPWSRSFGAFVKLGLLVIALRIVFQAVFGAHVGGTIVLFELPSADLPKWAAGVRIGGPVTLEAVVLAVYEGLRLAAILACVGAANALADPRRLLKSVPGALYETGVAVVVALTFAPRLVEDAARVRAAHRLRGQSTRGLHALRRIVMPVLEGSLESALALASAMDSRGFGRRAAVTARRRRATGVLVVAGLFGICLGVYGLLDGTTPGWFGPGMVLLGVATAGAGFVAASRATVRTRYRPDPWAWPEWAVSSCGLVCVITFSLAAARGLPGMNLLVVPLVLPQLPWLPIVGLVVALAPAVLAPVPPDHLPTRTLTTTVPAPRIDRQEVDA
jgi:energy-coupling factor transport system permease protein